MECTHVERHQSHISCEHTLTRTTSLHVLYVYAGRRRRPIHEWTIT